MGNVIYKEVASQPGIQRDGTLFDSEYYIDGQNVRFYKGRALKMGGRTTLQNGTQDIIRDVFSYDVPIGIQLFLGRESKLSYVIINSSNNLVSSETVITPAGFAGDPDNIWSFATVSYAEVTYILAVAAPNGSSISNTTRGIVYYGPIGTTGPLTPLIPTTPPGKTEPLLTAGGIVVLGQYVLLYDSDGLISWNNGEDILNWPDTNTLNFGSDKFVAAAPVRSGSVVSGLFWSTGGVMQLALQPDAAGKLFFDPNYISTRSTILSSRSVVSFEPYFFWIGDNSFWIYNGIVQELKNDMNKQWFFNNLNPSEKQKVVGFVHSRKYGDVGWLFSYGDATENNWLLLHNVGGQFWFDTNNIDRSCAISAGSNYPYPIMCSSTPIRLGNNFVYPIWAHEFGVNQVQFNISTALVSYHESSLVNLWEQAPEAAVIMVDTLIPDIQLVENIFFQINKRGYPNSVPTASETFTITPTTEFLTMKEKGSFLSFRFETNTLDADYLMGKTLVKLVISEDQRPGPTT